MVFSILGTDALDAVINVRLTSLEKSLLRQDADFSNVGMSELVRRRYFGKPLIASEDAVMIKELRRLSVVVQQIKRENPISDGTQTDAVLQAIVSHINLLASKQGRE
jgi:hypothetical protein